jgi:hypothetical protein
MANDSKLINKDVKLIGRDFGQFRKLLIDFSKNYFPNTYNDFNEASPGMMFIEMASYVGDVLSFYTDTQLRESLLTNAEEPTNVFNLAAAYGYKPKNVVQSTVELDVFQLVPAIGTGDDVRPDFRYALSVNSKMIVGSTQYRNVEFRTIKSVEFSKSSSFDTTDVSVYQVDETSNEPLFYLLKKKVNAVSGREKQSQYQFNNPRIYDKIRINDENIIGIKSITDSDGDTWTEVPFLAQETVFEQVDNNDSNSTTLYQYSDETPNLLRLNRVPKRFITRFDDTDELVVQFGAGVSSNADEEILPNPDNVGSALYNATANIDQGIDPSNFLYTKTYGTAPSNTTLTVTYLIGNGVQDNVPQRDLTTIISRTFGNDVSIELDSDLLSFVQKSLAVTNENPASGARSKEGLDEIRNNAISYFGAQNRSVTKEDYVMRCYALPPQFGSIVKAHLVQDYQLNYKLAKSGVVRDEIDNPLALNLYTLGYDNNKKLTQLNLATKTNLKNYIDYYRLLTDAVNIKDAYIVNIAIDFEIIVLPNSNSNEVLLRCINALKEYFNIEKWAVSQPINISKLYVLLDGIQGVQTVVRPNTGDSGGIQITNKYNGNYAPNKYGLNTATKNGIIYPPKDPSIFEVKFPDTDIRGRVVSLSF